MARLKGLTKNQLTILAIGCGDSAEGPYISMPDGKQVFLKASQLTWLARQLKAYAETYEEVPATIEDDEDDDELDAPIGKAQGDPELEPVGEA